jgi:hypothetical protein
MRFRCCLFAALLALMPSVSRADEEDVPPIRYPKVASAGATREAFVPKGWKIEQALDADFDRDGRKDVLLLLRMTAKRNLIRPDPDAFGFEFDSNPRMLVGLLAVQDGYRLLFDDHKLIPRWDNPMIDDPLQKVRATPGGFIIKLEHFANAGTWWVVDATLRFRFEAGCMRLIGFDRVDSSRGSGEVIERSLNYLTGTRTCAHYLSQEGQTKGNKRKTALGVRPPICIDTVGDGLRFQSEPPPDVCPELDLGDD